MNTTSNGTTTAAVKVKTREDRARGTKAAREVSQGLALEDARAAFVRTLTGRNLSSHTITAYGADVGQFTSWLESTNVSIGRPEQVTRSTITDYLVHLANLGSSGVTRARKLAALREFFRYLAVEGVISTSPATSIEMPQKERKQRVYLRPDEFSKMLAVAGGNPRDFAILQLFLQLSCPLGYMPTSAGRQRFQAFLPRRLRTYLVPTIPSLGFQPHEKLKFTVDGSFAQFDRGEPEENL
jgi:integrase